MEAEISIRPMTPDDKPVVFSMMRTFYDSPAVLHTAPDKILEKDIDDALSDMPFLQGYMLILNGETAGYAMAACSYTTEYGGICVWLEDLYLKPEYRRMGISGALFRYLEEHYTEAVRFKLEVEPENENAVACYKRRGYKISPYYLMTKEIDT